MAMKKFLYLIPIIALVSCGDDGPNSSSNRGGFYTHSENGAGCEENYYNDPDHWLPKDEEYGKCPEEYSIHCAKRGFGVGDHVQKKYIDTWGNANNPDAIEYMCRDYGGADDGEIH